MVWQHTIGLTCRNALAMRQPEVAELGLGRDAGAVLATHPSSGSGVQCLPFSHWVSVGGSFCCLEHLASGPTNGLMGWAWYLKVACNSRKLCRGAFCSWRKQPSASQKMCACSIVRFVHCIWEIRHGTGQRKEFCSTVFCAVAAFVFGKQKKIILVQGRGVHCKNVSLTHLVSD